MAQRLEVLAHPKVGRREADIDGAGGSGGLHDASERHTMIIISGPVCEDIGLFFADKPITSASSAQVAATNPKGRRHGF
jgi:hypothetical protein